MMPFAKYEMLSLFVTLQNQGKYLHFPRLSHLFTKYSPFEHLAALWEYTLSIPNHQAVTPRRFSINYKGEKIPIQKVFRSTN